MNDIKLIWHFPGLFVFCPVALPQKQVRFVPDSIDSPKLDPWTVGQSVSELVKWTSPFMIQTALIEYIWNVLEVSVSLSLFLVQEGFKERSRKMWKMTSPHPIHLCPTAPPHHPSIIEMFTFFTSFILIISPHCKCEGHIIKSAGRVIGMSSPLIRERVKWEVHHSVYQNNKKIKWRKKV